jgi:2,3-bisphosphoglycerate-independent phosphoglycerate mutase
VPSDQNIPFDEKPAMQSSKITDLGIKALKSGKYNQVRLNFPNPDMVGHTGNLQATIEACTIVDKCVKVSGAKFGSQRQNCCVGMK